MSTAMKLLLLVAASLVASCHGAFDTSFASKLDEIKKTLDEAQQDGIATSRNPLDNMDFEDLKISSRLLMQASPSYPPPLYPPPSYPSPPPPPPPTYGANMMDTLPDGVTEETARRLNFSVIMEGDWSRVQSQMEPFMLETRTEVAKAMGTDFYRGQVEMNDVREGSIVSTITLLLDPAITEDKVESYKTKLTTDSTIFTPLSRYGITSTSVTFTGDSKIAAPPRDGAASVTSASATTILAAFGTLLLGALLF